MGWFDDDRDAVVVAVAQPVEGHAELVTNNHSNKNRNNSSGDKTIQQPDAHSSDGYSTQRSLSRITQW
jgi:hypothetical protein